MRRKLLPHRRAVQEGPALVGRDVAKAAEGHHHCLATRRRQVAPLGEKVARFLPLGRRKAFQYLFALADALLLLGSHGVPLPQALADQLLALRRQALELRIIRHNVSLLRGGQFTQPLENTPRLGTFLRTTPASPAIGFLPTRTGRWVRPARAT